MSLVEITRSVKCGTTRFWQIHCAITQVVCVCVCVRAVNETDGSLPKFNGKILKQMIFNHYGGFVMDSTFRLFFFFLVCRKFCQFSSDIAISIYSRILTYLHQFSLQIIDICANIIQVVVGGKKTSNWFWEINLPTSFLPFISQSKRQRISGHLAYKIQRRKPANYGKVHHFSLNWRW